MICFVRYSLLFLGFICSCKSYTDKPLTGKQVDLDKKSSISLSRIFSNIEIVSLEDDNNFSIIVKGEKMIEYQDNYYILDNLISDVKKFNIEGKFIKSIGKKGHGPGEYNHLRDFNIKNDTLTILSLRPAKLLLFDLNGKYLSYINLPSELGAVKYFSFTDNDNQLLFFSMFSESELYVFNKSNNSLKSLLPKIPEYIPQNTIFNPNSTPFYLKNSEVSYNQFYSNNVYKYNDNKFYLDYSWDFGKYNFNIYKDLAKDQNKDYYKKNYSELLDKYAFYFFNNIENKDYIFSNFIYKGQTHLLIYDKEFDKYYFLDKFNEGVMLPVENVIFFNRGIQALVSPHVIDKFINSNLSPLFSGFEKKIDEISQSNNYLIIKYYFNNSKI